MYPVEVYICRVPLSLLGLFWNITSLYIRGEVGMRHRRDRQLFACVSAGGDGACRPVESGARLSIDECQSSRSSRSTFHRLIIALYLDSVC